MIWEENQTKYGSIKAVGFIRYLLKHGKWQWHKDVLNTQQKKNMLPPKDWLEHQNMRLTSI